MTDEKEQQHEHPMVPVPDAIRTVLLETAKVIISGQQTTEESLSVDSPWQELLGKTLSQDVLMQAPGYPPYNASIMDGYAIQSSENKKAEADLTYSVIDKVYAGDGAKVVSEPYRNGFPVAFYVTTGAVIPTGFDCVIPIEDISQGFSESDQKIKVLHTATIQEGAWIRKIGCDIKEGSIVLPAGYKLDHVGLGLIKQAGVEHVLVKKPVQVGILSTGNELIRKIEEGTQVGRIPDVNRPVLLSLLSTLGTCTPIDLGIERDDNLDSLTKTIQTALETCEVIITTGGISMGESDVVEQILVERLGGTLHVGRLHMKPGKPTTFVTLLHQGVTKLIFAMPGNPVSAVVCTRLLVHPCLDLLFRGADDSIDTHGKSTDDILQMIVSKAWVNPEIKATLAHGVKLDKERPEYHRVTLQQKQNGKYEATSTGIQQSSRLMSLRDAQGLLLLPQGTPGGKMTADAGEEFTVLMLNCDGTHHAVQVCNSVHLAKQNKASLRIAVVHVVSPSHSDMVSLDHLSCRVQTALSGAKSGLVDIISSRAISCEPDLLLPFCCDLNDPVDVFCVVCHDNIGSFRGHADICLELRKNLDKVADSMALQARRGAASEDASAAMYEVVVGFVPKESAMMIVLSERGMEGGLKNVRGLLKHALKIGRGK